MGKVLKRNNYKRLILVSRLLFWVYLASLMYFLLFAEGFGRTYVRDEYSYNLSFFKEINRYLNWAGKSETGFKMMLLNVWGNVVCFVPFGFLIPIVFKKIKNCVPVTILAFTFSLVIEVFQLMFKIGSFDVDDTFLNTVGGIAGYILYKIVKFVLLKREKKS